MVIDTGTVGLLLNVLDSASKRSLFNTIAEMRIASEDDLKGLHLVELDSDLGALQRANLIGKGNEGKYYVTAKGLKVERDMAKLAVGFQNV